MKLSEQIMFWPGPLSDRRKLSNKVAQLEVALDKRLRQEYMDEDHRLGGIGITYEQFRADALLTGEQGQVLDRS